MIQPGQITALILAGGKSRRMGGRDKGLLPFGTGVLAGQVLEQIRPQVGQVLISANRNREQYAQLGCPVLGDPLEGFPGPLAGFLAGLDRMNTDYLLTLPCDGPLVLPDLARRLASGLQQADARIAVAHDGQRLQPVCALLHRSLRDDLCAALEQGERKVARWNLRHRWTRVDFSDAPQAFANINTPQDYAAITAMNTDLVASS